MVRISARSTRPFSRVAQRNGNRNGTSQKILCRFVAIVIGLGVTAILHNVSIRRRERENSQQKLSSYQHDMETSDHSDKSCALLFFGLVKDFKDLALPAIKRNIIGPNPHCDIFLHTYAIDKVPTNERNHEGNGTKIDPSEAYLLTDNVIIESMDSFFRRRGPFLEHSRKFHHQGWGKCCVSHDNMIKQWHSIAGVWELMRQHEKKKLRHQNSSKAFSKKDHYYQQVGLFRADVYQVNPIDIFNSNATVPDFAHNEGYNDRLFYGSYPNAELWADRFGFAPIFEKKYMFHANYWNRLLKFLGVKKGHDGYHSEFFLGNLMEHNSIALDLQDICVWRIRSGKRLQVSDCANGVGMKKYQSSNWVHGYKYAPEGYIFESENFKWAGHWSAIWDEPVRVDDDVGVLKVNMNEVQSSPLGPGVLVLGMFQSGASLLSGILAEGYGFHMGDTNEDFELTSMISQNDAFMWGQGLTSETNVARYAHEPSWEQMKSDTLPTACGAVALRQLYSQTGIPWLLNDARLCITLQTWLPLLESKPAVIYIYRDPLEVALLLQKEHGFELSKGLLLWILYNKSAIQNFSKDLCRITTSNHAMIRNPLVELDSIVDNLTKCGLPRPPKKINQDILNSFQEKHGTNVKEMPVESHSIVESTGGCTIYKYEPHDGAFSFIEASLHSKAAAIFCDLESGLAYNNNYVWPELTNTEINLHLQLDRDPVDIEKLLRERYHRCK